jgi:hypothetical protein
MVKHRPFRAAMAVLGMPKDAQMRLRFMLRTLGMGIVNQRAIMGIINRDLWCISDIINRDLWGKMDMSKAAQKIGMCSNPATSLFTKTVNRQRGQVEPGPGLLRSSAWLRIRMGLRVMTISNSTRIVKFHWASKSLEAKSITTEANSSNGTPQCNSRS